MTWLVTGGAGYLGGHTVLALQALGHAVVVLDDLSTGDPARLPASVPLVVGSVGDRPTVTRVLREFEVAGVLHLAARKSVPESVAAPLDYYAENVGGLVTLLRAMVDARVGRLLFASSAAVYGTPRQLLATEATRPVPTNPYGESKLAGELLLDAVGRAHGISWIALRHFNAVGAGGPLLADHGGGNLVPRIFRALADGRPLPVYGGDHPTPDGTALRDYVHVEDVTAAHVAAVRRLLERPTAEVYNVGTGHGHSVLEVLELVGAVTGRPPAHRIGPARPGEPAQVVAGVAKIRRQLGWRATRDLAGALRSAWSAHCARPVASADGSSR
jgi:UDP-glucose 4-epimerase